MSQYTVLYVDAESDVDSVQQALDGTDSLKLLTRHTVDAAVEVFESEPVDCVVTGYELPSSNGLSVIDAIRQHQSEIPCVLLASVPPEAIETDSFESLVVEYVNRELPDALDRLEYIIKDLITHNAHAGFLLPENEQARLEALEMYAVDELPVSDSFDRLTTLIASHFDVAVAFIGLIDRSTEEIIACAGAGWTQLQREETICTHSMLQEEVMVVENIADDARFSANETLDKLDIVSYAGANLTTPAGKTIGQLCLIEHEPRTYSETERTELQAFADLAMEILELRRLTQNDRYPEEIDAHD